MLKENLHVVLTWNITRKQRLRLKLEVQVRPGKPMTDCGSAKTKQNKPYNELLFNFKRLDSLGRSLTLVLPYCSCYCLVNIARSWFEIKTN